MPPITSELLDAYPYRRYANARSMERGRVYYEENRVTSMNFVNNNSEVICQIDGDTAEYQVEIAVDAMGALRFNCTCPSARRNFCKHQVATALEVSRQIAGKDPSEYQDLDENSEWVEDADYDFDPDAWMNDEDKVEDNAPKSEGFFNSVIDQFLKTITPKALAAPPVAQKNIAPPTPNWQSRLDYTLSQIPRAQSATTGASPQRYVAVFLLNKEEYSYGNSSFYYSPYIVKIKNWARLNEVDLNDKLAINNLLNSDDGWLKYGEDLHAYVNPQGCINLPSEAINLLLLLNQTTRYLGDTNVTSYFPLLAQFGIPVFLASKYKSKIYSRLQILPNPMDLQVSFTKEDGNLVLKASLQTDPPIHGKVETLSYNPSWLLCVDKIFTLRNASAMSVMASFPIVVPAQHADIFREKYLRRVAELLPIDSDIVHWRDVNAEAVPRLYLNEGKDAVLRASLRFGYGEYELAASKSEETVAVETVPDSWDLIRIHRDGEREAHFYQLLTDPVYRLKRAKTNFEVGTFELRARAHPFDFLLHSVPHLTQAGFEIYGEENLKLGKINRATPSAHVSISSGIDWFDIKAYIEYGDQQVSLHDVRKAMKRGEKYIKLADGSAGQIPEEWLAKYKHLFGMAEETADGFRVADFHLPLVDQLIEEDAAIQTPVELIQRREHLRSFERIAAQPLPKNFVGELRHYQKAGFDWLHFLREYKFGGILADDMGLGKTIQVLTYLQSLKENRNGGAYQDQSAEKETLLVVPKSLIANWQRESEKFTPDLKFLDYTGNFRDKDVATFKDYDVILTTYGVLLRDIEALSKYHFDTVVLDESQAIKNPASQSAKAARLLKAAHRIVMTGTPVENNTFELWSQFAFLNPGLLGSVEYFKKEFANPIEVAGDEKVAKLLRQLVYPFILRRTKAQVAPELPPRTERVVYTDMVPAQKKLYALTREKYRAELLGLIESDGMNDARFKILEGLLRLRQISIHPNLVDKSYKGEAPKFEFLIETLETLQAENHKALVFSQFVETLKLLRKELDARKIKYMYLDGQTQNRQDRVDSFQGDPSIPFFLISLKAGGVGLNLTAADYVIHLDPWWNPAVEMQASDRAHRIGQDKPVIVYKIIARESVEEKILQLQEKKKNLVNQLISTEGSFFKSLTKEDVGALFG